MARRRPAKGAIIALVLASAIGNVGGTLFFWNTSGGPIAAFALCLALGLMVAQPCSLAVWCALGAQKFVLRIPLTMGILACLVFLYTGTLFVMENSMPLEIPIVFVASSLVLNVLIQVPLWIFRVTTGNFISPLITHQETEQGSQFGIKHLMMATAIAAVIAAVSNYVFGTGELDRGVRWVEVTGFLMAFELLVSMITLLCVALVFSNVSRVPVSILTAIVVIAGPIGVRETINAVTTGGFNHSILINIYGFTISLTMALTVVLFAFYSMGYRMKRAKN